MEGFFIFRLSVIHVMKRKAFFYVQEKNMSGEDDDYFSSIGNMYSGSYDPEEQNRALEREAERRRREQEREQARILREQQAAQAEQQKNLQKPPPQAVDIDNTKPAPVFKTDPDDPYKGLDASRRNDMLMNRFSAGNDPKSPLGRPLTGPERDDYIHGWKNKVNGMTQDQKDISFILNARHDPVFRQWIELESQLRQKQQEGAQTLELRLDDKDNPSNAYRTLEYRPERDGVPSIQKAIQYGNAPVKVVKADDNFLSQIMSVNVPQDESMGRAYDYLNDNAIAPMEGNESWKNNPVGHPDSSYAEAERQAGKAVTGYVNKAMGSDSKIQGEDKNRIVGHPDESYGNAIGSVSENMGMNSTVTGKGREVVGHPNMSYWSNWNTEESRKIPWKMVTDGAKQAVEDTQIMFLSGAVVLGEVVHSITGGDPTSIRKTQALLDAHQAEMKKLDPMTVDKIYVEGNPEATMQNVTRYMYQELGNQIVKVPAYYIWGKLDTFAELFGMSTAAFTAKLHADIRDSTGESKIQQSVMYAIPLGLMSAFALPFKLNMSFKSAKEAKDYVMTMAATAGIRKGQNVGERMVVNKLTNTEQERGKE